MFKDVTLARAVTWLEDSVITLSGPLLAISSIIAGVDVVTNNALAESLTWIGYVWAYALMLTLDFQVLALGVKAHHVYASSEKTKKRKCIEIGIAVLIAIALAYVSVQMHAIFARVNGANVSIAVAQQQLGINPIALIYERSALVLVLIFMSGWLRNPSQKTEDRTPEPNTITINAETVNIVNVITEMREELAALKEAVTQPRLVAMNTTLALPEPNITEQESEKKHRIYEYLRMNPAASVGDIENACIVSRSYASVIRSEWRKLEGQ